MKIAKKLLIGVLAVAILVSGLLIASFAEDAETPGADGVDIPDYENVLKYYDPLYSTLYANENYEDGTYAQDVFISMGAPDLDIDVKTVAGESYMQLKLGHILDPDARTDIAYRVNFGETVRQTVFSADISAAHDDVKGLVCAACGNTETNLALSLCPRCYGTLELVSSSAPVVSVFASQTDAIGVALVKFDYRSGVVSYNNGEGYTSIDGLAAKEGQWYSVSIVFDKTMYSIVIDTVVDGVAKSYERFNNAAPITSLSSMSVGSTYVDDSRCGIIRIDDLFVQRGVDNRTVGIDVAAKTAEGLTIISDILANPAFSNETKLAAVAVYDQLTGVYGDKLAHSESVDALLDKVEGQLLAFFGDSLVSAVAGMNASHNYSSRLEFVTVNQSLVDRVEPLLTEDSAAYIEAIASFYAEKEALAVLEVNSIAFMEYLAEFVEYRQDILSSSDYEVLMDFVEYTESIYEPGGVKSYDPTYPALKDSYALYSTTAFNYHSGLKNAEIFCANAPVAALAEAALAEDFEGEFSAEQFAESLAAYDVLVDLNFSNDTFPGMAEALEIYEGLNKLREVSDIAVRFIDYVDTAEQAIYIFQVENWLELASQYVDAETNSPNPYYPGVNEALKKYEALSVEIETKKQNAIAYIDAVNAISGKTGDELIAAIENALALREAGNVLGYEGVSEANIALDNANSSEELRNLYASKFISLVNAIDEDADLEERFNQLAEAKRAEGKADASIEGVSAAKNALKNASIAYSQAISAINESNEGVINNGTAFAVTFTSASELAKLVISAIKAIVA